MTYDALKRPPPGRIKGVTYIWPMPCLSIRKVAPADLKARRSERQRVARDSE